MKQEIIKNKTRNYHIFTLEEIEKFYNEYFGSENVKSSGKEFITLCPFHDDTHPSFYISKETGQYHCKSCEEKGNIITFSKHFKIDLKDRYLNKSHSIIHTKSKSKSIQISNFNKKLLKLIQQAFVSNLFTNHTDIVHEIEITRGYTRHNIEDYGIGYCSNDGNVEAIFEYLIKNSGIVIYDNNNKVEDIQSSDVKSFLHRVGIINEGGFISFQNRITYPYYIDGDCVYFIAGKTKETPNDKYNSQKYLKLKTNAELGIENVLYGIDSLKFDGDTIYILEGITDAISAKIAFDNNVPVISACGANFTNKFYDLLEKSDKTKVVLIPDSEVKKDVQKCVEETVNKLLHIGKKVFTVELERGEGVDKIDVCDYIRDYGKDIFIQFVECNKVEQFKKSKSESGISDEFIEHCLNGIGEIDDAKLFTKFFKNKIIFDSNDEIWYELEGCYYVSRKQIDLISRFEDILNIYSGFISDKYKVDVFNKHINSLKQYKKMSTILTICRGIDFLGRDDIIWDDNGYLLGCNNCIIDLRTGKEVINDGTIFIKNKTNVEWKGLDKKCPKFEEFLNTIFNNNADLIAVNRKLLGLSILGGSEQDVFPIYYGERGRNGKTTLFTVLEKILGNDLVYSFNNELILEQTYTKHSAIASPDKMAFKGKRLIFSSEISKNRKIDTTEVKKLTGGDAITGRHLYKSEDTFFPTHTMFLFCNHFPSADAEDNAFWERVIVVPFEISFVKNPTYNWERLEDVKKEQQLMKEQSGILSWLVRECIDYQKNGIIIPNICKEETFLYRDSEDYFSQFLNETCEFNDDFNLKSNDLFLLYKSWCILHNIKPSLREFSIDMKKRFIVKRKNTGFIYYGIRIVKSEEVKSKEIAKQYNGF